MYAIHRISRMVGQKAELLCQYQFVDPFGAQPVNDSYAFMQMRNDWEIFYQNSYPYSWLNDDALVCAPFAAHGPTEALVMAWRNPGTDKNYGLSIVSIERFRTVWTTELESGVSILDCCSTEDLTACFAVLQSSAGIQLKGIDMTEQTLV